jgi:malonyl-CoA O-methyltransferase
MTDDAKSILARMQREFGNQVPADVIRRRDRAASSLESADFLFRRAHEGIIDRLAPLVMQPQAIVDLGAGTGVQSRALARQFRKARVISIDASQAMVDAARRQRPFLSKTREIRAASDRLPLPDGSVDLVYANLWLAWVDNLPACFAEIARVLAKGGVFTFATLGPDTFANLREAHAGDMAVRAFADMHDIGDLLVQAGLAEPILDIDKLTVSYDDADALFRDLSAVGARNTLTGRRRTLTGKTRFERFRRTLESQGRLAVDVELVYGHAWGSGPRPPAGEFHVDPATIGRLPGSR